MTDDLIREVNEAMQQERWHQLWKRYGGKMIYGCAAIVALAGGMIVWQQRETYQHQQQTAKLMEARELFVGGEYDKAQEQFAALAKKASGQPAILANLWLAKAALANENQTVALDALAAIVKDNPKPTSAFIAMACVQGAMLAPDDARFANCLPVNPEDPLYGMAKEQLVVQAAGTHDFAKAKDELPAHTLPLTQERRLEDVKTYLKSAEHDQ